ncbi:MAG: sialate O-acetylesterase [Pirellulaceae bacterium]|nr:sialate O-acetylesterase [Pirellulaceae bacterium]
MFRRQLATVLVFGGMFTLAFPAWAAIKLPALISDHMVLQSDMAAPIWGWAEPGEEVTVAIADQSAQATADKDGKWQVKLPKLAAGGAHTLTVRGKSNEIVVKDVLVGEVWLGSGQSNMAMVVSSCNNAGEEIAAADFPKIRMFTVTSTAADSAQADCEGSWQVCSPQTAGRFSASLYFCGREIHKALGVPVGLINSSVGGTPIESWISADVQEKSPELKEFVAAAQAEADRFDPVAAQAKYEKDLAQWEVAAKAAKAAGRPAPRKPIDQVANRARKGTIGGLYHGKIAPLVPYAMRGAVWYQGEANSNPAKSRYYEHQLPLLVTSWRAAWGSEFPFAWVQLPNFDGLGGHWPVVREAMLKSLKLPKTGMAITIDIGDAKDIHPKNKQDVGKRLAQWALGEVYGKDGPTSGPLPAGHERRGKDLVLKFSHADGGLVAKGGELRGFVVAGADKAWKPAAARIEGDQVIVSSPEVAEPVAARYAWENNPVCNLVSGAGLPASPFRTDNWEP